MSTPKPFVSDEQIAQYASQYVLPYASEVKRACEHMRNLYEPHVQQLVRERDEALAKVAKAAQQEEQGLEDGDYTDASKEVADALTAMGWGWYDNDVEPRVFIMLSRHKNMAHVDSCKGEVVYYSNADFISRSRVTAKKLGLVPREEQKEEWKVGDWAVCDSSHSKDHNGDPYWTKTMEDYVGVPMQVKAVGEEYINAGGSFAYHPSWLRPATPAEIADHEAKLKAKEEEQKLARLTFGTRVEYEGDKGWKVAMDMPSPDGTYAIVKEGHARMGWTKASQLTIID